jgi:DNA-binding transcriptional regulator YdaS (Cro superfamily)
MENDSPKPAAAAALDHLALRRAALQRAIDIAKGQLPLANAIGTTQSQVWYWLERAKKGVAPEFCGAIERFTGVPANELRPDIFPSPATEVSS